MEKVCICGSTDIYGIGQLGDIAYGRCRACGLNMIVAVQDEIDTPTEGEFAELLYEGQPEVMDDQDNLVPFDDNKLYT